MTNWKIDASHSLAEFSVKHMMIATVKGRFGHMEGTIKADPANLTTAQFNVAVDLSTIDTREADRDAHLKSADFFDVENHPTMTFVSKKVEAKGDDEYTLIGDLTIRGVTKEVAFNLTFEGQAQDPWGNQRIGLSATSVINRKEFGLEWNAALEAGGVLVGEKVKIEVHLEGVAQ